MSEFVTWSPLRESNEPDDKSLAIEYTVDPRLAKEPDLHIQKLQERASEYFDEAYSYLQAFLPDTIPLTRKWHVKLSPQSQHGAMGVAMHLSVHHIALEPSASEYRVTREKSLIVHEVLHNLRDEEDFSMFIEMIYIIEHGQARRIEEIKQLYSDGALPDRYVKGLQQIADWLGLGSPEQLFESIAAIGVDRLKVVFRERLEEYVKTF